MNFADATKLAVVQNNVTPISQPPVPIGLQSVTNLNVSIENEQKSIESYPAKKQNLTTYTPLYNQVSYQLKTDMHNSSLSTSSYPNSQERPLIMKHSRNQPSKLQTSETKQMNKTFDKFFVKNQSPLPTLATPVKSKGLPSKYRYTPNKSKTP